MRPRSPRDDSPIGEWLERAELRPRNSSTWTQQAVASRWPPGHAPVERHASLTLPFGASRAASRRCTGGRTLSRSESSSAGRARRANIGAASVSNSGDPAARSNRPRRSGRRWRGTHRGAGTPGSPAAAAAVGAERAHDRRELMLEAAARVTQRGDAGEHVREVAGVVPDPAVVGDVRRARSEVGGGARPARGVLEDSVLAAGRVAAARSSRRPRPCPRLMTARWRSGRPSGAFSQRGHEASENSAAGCLATAASRRVVDDEQDVQLARRRERVLPLRAGQSEAAAAPRAAPRSPPLARAGVLVSRAAGCSPAASAAHATSPNAGRRISPFTTDQCPGSPESWSAKCGFPLKFRGKRP